MSLMDMLFFFNKTVSFLSSPLSLSFVFLLMGSVFLWFTRKQTAGKILVTIGVLIIVPLSFNAVAEKFLKPLEEQYPPLMLDSPGSQQGSQNGPAIKWIVVLGGGHVSDPNVPLTSQISPGSLVRLTEGVRLYRKLAGSKIVLMGGAVFDPLPEVETEAKIAAIMNIDRNDLVLEKLSKDTEDQAKFIRNIVGKDQFILVTSASHMPRSVALFKRNGMNPIPAPTHHRVLERQGLSPVGFLPTIEGLGKAENAIYEYLSFYWSKMRGKL
jgi:uncharacterized SAM-binding protein YcdF (DUF218 family)